MLLAIQTITWSNNFFLPRGYPDMCNLLDGLVVLGCKPLHPGRGLPYGSGLGLSRCLGPGECLHSFMCVNIYIYIYGMCVNM